MVNDDDGIPIVMIDNRYKLSEINSITFCSVVLNKHIKYNYNIYIHNKPQEFSVGQTIIMAYER